MLYCVCVYIYICGNTVLLLQGLIVCDVNKENCETMIQCSVSILDIMLTLLLETLKVCSFAENVKNSEIVVAMTTQCDNTCWCCEKSV